MGIDVVGLRDARRLEIVYKHTREREKRVWFSTHERERDNQSESGVKSLNHTYAKKDNGKMENGKKKEQEGS